MAEVNKACIIIGGGVGGLIQAAELIRKKIIRTDDLQIFERESDYGGVWKAATYPGAACDVFSCTYQISWHRNADWDCLFPTGPELVRYYKSFADHYDLPACTLFGQNCIQATWSEDRSLWIVDIQDVQSGKCTKWTTQILIQAAGTYNRKSTPPIPGIVTFKGDMWHTADWPESYDFTGKTVAYVGTGPTSVQVLPHLQAQAKTVNIFCRSMTYCHPFINIVYPNWIKWAFRWIPGLLAFYASLVGCLFGIWAYFVFRPETWLAKYEERYCRGLLLESVSDPQLREQLTPTGRFGSKRPLVSLTGFFDVLQKDNINVISNPIIAVDTSGVITKTSRTGDVAIQISGEAAAVQPQGESQHIQADVLIWGTGFKMQGWGGAVPTIGRSGKLLSEHWAEYPKTLHGTMTSSFPNLFLVNGPNTTTPWSSLIKGLEYQAINNLRVIRHIRQQSVEFPSYTLEPKASREEDWTQSMQPELDKLCTSPKYGPGFYYLSADGRNTFFWPWSQTYYWWKTRRFNLVDYVENKGYKLGPSE